LKNASKKLDGCLIGTVHIFNVAATDFAAINQFEKLEAEFTATLMNQIKQSIAKQTSGNTKAGKKVAQLCGPIMNTPVSQ